MVEFNGGDDVGYTQDEMLAHDSRKRVETEIQAGDTFRDVLDIAFVPKTPES